MSDLISRSRAIKEVSEWATDILHPQNLIKEDAIHILESLPSAEPNQVVIRNCRDCVFNIYPSQTILWNDDADEDGEE